MPSTQSDLLWGWLQRADLGSDGRLPPERELADRLNLSRSELRKGLGELERRGVITRHVGRGTFLIGSTTETNLATIGSETGSKGEEKRSGSDKGSSGPHRQEPAPPAPPAPAGPSGPPPKASPLPGQLALPFGPAVEASLAEIAEARIALEPRLAALAARRASRSEVAEIRRAEADLLLAADRGNAPAADRRLHRAIALAARNRALLHAYDEMMRLADEAPVRAGGDRPEALSRGPASDEHRRIVEAILRGDQEGAAAAAREHVAREHEALFGPPS